MSPPDRATLEALATEMRTLPTRGDSPAERLESAGRLLIEAMEAGAFGAPELAGFRSMVRQRLEQVKVNGSISAWCEAVWWLKGRPASRFAPEQSLLDDIELVVAAMLGPARTRKRPGRPCDTDPALDRRISEAWKDCGCLTFAEFERTDAGRQFGLSARKLKGAHERHRKRVSRRAVKDV